MARGNVLSTRTINYLELIGNGKHYRVPPYQRDLWNDLVDLRADSAERHYLGALVIEERGDREFLIIDGQQRLATLSVLALAVIARLHTMAGEGIEAAANEERARELAKAVSDRVATTPSGVFERLKPIYVDDAKVRQDFAGLEVGTGGRKRKLAKYILARLEEDASGRACDPDTDPGTIEHILPENPADEWDEDFDHARWDASVYRIGNLTLLEAATNRSIGNATYRDKLAAYGESKYALSKEIPGMAPEQWTPELLEARQMQLATRAVHLWRIDSA